jgi:hypothetical protein
MKCRKMIGVLVFTIVLGLCLPVSAAILSDDFDDDSGVLTGETANTGQTWAAISGRTSLDIGTQFGQSGNGAGNANSSGTMAWKANTISLGQIVNDETIVISVDFKKQHTAGGQELSIVLKSSGQNKDTALVFASDWLKIAGGWNYGAVQTNIGIPTNVHLDWTMNLNAGGTNTGFVDWYDIDNPSTNGTLVLDGSAYTGATLNYDTVQLWAYTKNSKITGFDNISVVPEPATMLLLSSGALFALLRRRK